MTRLRQVLASNIKKYRALRGFSQMKLAEKVDTATNYIALIETGKKFPSDRILEKIAYALNIETIDLFSTHVDVDILLQVGLIEEIYNDILSEITTLLQERVKKHKNLY